MTPASTPPRRHTYTVRVTADPDGRGYNVEVPALPEVYTYGATVEQALESARDVIALWVADREEQGLPVPDETPAAGTYLVQIAA